MQTGTLHHISSPAGAHMLVGAVPFFQPQTHAPPAWQPQLMSRATRIRPSACYVLQDFSALGELLLQHPSRVHAAQKARRLRFLARKVLV